MKLYTAGLLGCALALYVVLIKAIDFAADHDSWRGTGMMGVALIAFVGVVGILAIIIDEHTREEDPNDDS